MLLSVHRAREHSSRGDCSGEWYLQMSLLIVIHSQSVHTTSACEVPKPKSSFPSVQRLRNTPLGLCVLAVMCSWIGNVDCKHHVLMVSLGSNWVLTMVLSSHDMATEIHHHPQPRTAREYPLLLTDKKSMFSLHPSLIHTMQDKQNATLRVVLPFGEKECGWTGNAFRAYRSSRVILDDYSSTSQHL